MSIYRLIAAMEGYRHDEGSESLGVVEQMPMHSEFTFIKKRVESFSEWPGISSDGLAECGFYYYGDGDCVRCYYCGGGIRNWAVHDDPWVKHITAFPDCPHVLLNKGQRYVDRVKKICYGGQPFVIQAHRTRGCIGTVAAQTCLQMGFSEEDVRNAIELYSRINEDSTLRVHTLLEILLDAEDDMQQACSLDSINSSSKPVQTARDTKTTYSEEQRTQTDSPEALYEENCRLKEAQSCKICLDRTISIVFLPCGHLATCAQCAPAFRSCPIGRRPVSGYLRAIFVSSKREP